MAVRVFYLLLGLVAAVLSESVDYAVAAKSISAELSSPTFVAYSKPKQRVEEFIAPGVSAPGASKYILELLFSRFDSFRGLLDISGI